MTTKESYTIDDPLRIYDKKIKFNRKKNTKDSAQKKSMKPFKN